ncbi:MAG: hypothetical protein CVU11_14000 [Bacteroidetes bacterium HGW-Bacteroidetes-6]|jgi:hypothetical protein|nr:MAG: hypothetical protein CVU11_14000 [Bacteroidetes bacterium HGW-Bacteroidetes-6]
MIEEAVNHLRLAGVKSIFISITMDEKDAEKTCNKIESMLLEFGFEVFNPFKMEEAYKLFILNPSTNKVAENIYILAGKADALLLAPNWASDKFCRLDALLAVTVGKPIVDHNLQPMVKLNPSNVKFQYD